MTEHPRHLPHHRPADLEWDHVASGVTVTPEQARAVALLIAARFPDDPLVARHLLDMLGLIRDPGRGRP